MTRSASLEVHAIDVGQGDSVLVVNRDLAAVRAIIEAGKGTLPADPIDWVPYVVKHGVSLARTVRAAMLIDGGDNQYGGNVVAYLERHGVLTPGTPWTPNLHVVVSHYHDDHMAGLRSVFRKPGPKGGLSLVERYRPGFVYLADPGVKTRPTTQRYRSFGGDVDAAASAASNPTRIVRMAPGGTAPGTVTPTVVALGAGVGGIPIEAYVIAASQAVYWPPTGVHPIASATKVPDQNDRSVVIVVQYGSFRYFVGGDIAGNGMEPGGNVGDDRMTTATRKHYSTHADVETSLRQALAACFPVVPAAPGNAKYPAAGYCTVMKANHHGSASSMDVNLLATLRPAVLVVSSGVKARFHNHPTDAVMHRVFANPTWFAAGDSGATVPNSIKGVYVTEVAERWNGVPFGTNVYTASIVGDVVVRPVDEDVQAIQASDGTQKMQLNVQVYGTGVRTPLANPASALRPTLPVTAGIYPIGPDVHSDLHGG